MTIISDFATLKAQVQTYCARTDSTFGNMVETFVAAAEQRIFHGSGRPGDPLYSPALRCDDIETVTTLTTDVAGTVVLPSRCLDVRGLTVSGQDTEIKYMPPDRFKVWIELGSTGDSQYYTVEQGTLKIAPAAAVSLSVTIFTQPAALTVDASTSTTLTAFPMLYLDAVLHEAFTFLRNADLATAYLARYKSAVEGVNRTASHRRLLSGNMALSFEPIG